MRTPDPHARTGRSKEPTLFKVGLQLPWFDWPGSTDADLRSGVRAAAIGAETAGFASLWVMDHLYALEFESPPFPRAGKSTTRCWRRTRS